jgi:3' exoribonuclease, RNase T-like
MRIFVDTEFTDFIDCDLISIGLVAEDGREFYGERSDFDEGACSDFVRAAVLPQLGQYPGRMMERDALAVEVREWLDRLAWENDLTLCFDYGGDWELLVDLVDELPANCLAEQINSSLDPLRSEKYYSEHGGRHHALSDARASRYAMRDYAAGLANPTRK